MMAADRPDQKADNRVIGGLSVVAIGFAELISWHGGHWFRPYFGNLPPILAIFLLSIAGGAGLRFLQSRGWFRIFNKSRITSGLIAASAMASVLAIVVIAVDLAFRIPLKLNVPLPWSLLFYPAMAYVVEIVFHVLPLVAIRLIFKAQCNTCQPHRANLIFLTVTALLEPAFQWYLGFADKPYSVLGIYVAFHIFAINSLQVYVFVRYDFVSMYVFRLVYYLYWHIIWGSLRTLWIP